MHSGSLFSPTREWSTRCAAGCSAPADAEDATQETFLKLAKAAGQVERNLAAWLYASALRTSSNRFRANAARQFRTPQAAAG
ncbi:MAG TPA: sigma factor [Planctomycetota bacterium]|nr:sigma factor [Planctomycetota bacterium]